MKLQVHIRNSQIEILAGRRIHVPATSMNGARTNNWRSLPFTARPNNNVAQTEMECGRWVQLDRCQPMMRALETPTTANLPLHWIRSWQYLAMFNIPSLDRLICPVDVRPAMHHRKTFNSTGWCGATISDFSKQKQLQANSILGEAFEDQAQSSIGTFFDHGYNGFVTKHLCQLRWTRRWSGSWQTHTRRHSCTPSPRCVGNPGRTQSGRFRGTTLHALPYITPKSLPKIQTTISIS